MDLILYEALGMTQVQEHERLSTKGLYGSRPVDNVLFYHSYLPILSEFLALLTFNSYRTEHHSETKK